MTGEPLIVAKNLDMGYGHFVLMRDLNFTINRGDIFIIMGGSGCGKSTLLKILIGLKRPLRGKVLYGDVELLGDRSIPKRTNDAAIRDPLPAGRLVEFHDPCRKYCTAPSALYEVEPSARSETLSL